MLKFIIYLPFPLAFNCFGTNCITLVKRRKKLPVLPAAFLPKLNNRPKSHHPNDQHDQPEHRQQQAVIGAVADARPIIPI
jgi:hypothetical protein